MSSASTSALGGKLMMALFSAVVSAEELRAILSSAGGLADGSIDDKQLADIAQHLHLTLDSLHTLPDLGFAEVVTTDAGLADALEFSDAEVLCLESRTRRTLIRTPGSATWQQVGVVSCGMNQPLLPALMTDSDVPEGCTRSTSLPLVWQWASMVVAAGEAVAAQHEVESLSRQGAVEPAAQQCGTTAQPASQQGQQQQQQESELRDLDISRRRTTSPQAAAAAASVPSSMEPGEAERLASRARSFACSSLATRAACLRAGWQAVLRAASFSMSAGCPGAHLKLSQQRRAACLSRMAMSPVRAQHQQETTHVDVGQGKAAAASQQVPAAQGVIPLLAQAAARLVSHSIPLISH